MICTNCGVKAVVVSILNYIKQYMHTVAYMALHTQDTLPDLSIGALCDNCYLLNTFRDVASYFKVVWSKCTLTTPP